MGRFGVVVVMVLCAALAAAQDNASDPGDPPRAGDADTNGDPPLPGERLVSWEEAAQHVGEEVTVTGRVVDVHCSQMNCLLAFEPSFNKFTAVVPVNRFDLFPPTELMTSWRGRQVRVHGRIIDNDKKPEIVVQSADALRLSRGERRRDRDQRRQDELTMQSDAIDRLDTALARVESLTQQLAESEARIESLLVQLDQRIAQLTALQQNAGGGYEAPPPRNTWEALRTIKRGMSANEVIRLIGQPDSVDQSNGGWEIWYYPGGRTVSFDRRGRVQSVGGFTPP